MPGMGYELRIRNEWFVMVTTSTAIENLFASLRRGETRAVARAVSLVEDGATTIASNVAVASPVTTQNEATIVHLATTWRSRCFRTTPPRSSRPVIRA